METKVILSAAWAAQLKFSDKDLISLFDVDLQAAQSCNERFACPRCENDPEDSYYQFFVYDPITSPDTKTGTRYIGCVCGTVYCLGFKDVRQHFYPKPEAPLVEGGPA